MRLSREELKRLLAPLVIGLAALGAGAALLWSTGQTLAAARGTIAAAAAQYKQSTERLARIAEEEREVRQKLDVYQRLKQLHIVGEENRLEWADTVARIRRERELLDLRYTIERQKLLVSLPGKPGSVDFNASAMRVELALLHEEDLLRFLSDLRESGNAYYAVRRCDMTRTGQVAAGTTMTPRLRATCDIDLITIRDRGAKR